MLGKIICKGSQGDDSDFIRRFQNLINSSNHFDPKIRKSKKVVLITAAWKTSEFHEQHLKRVFREIGIESMFKDGYDENIQNLSIYYLFQKYKEENPNLYNLYHEKQETIKRIKLFYQTKNVGLVKTYWDQIKIVRQFFSDMPLYDIITFKQDDPTPDLAKLNQHEIEKLFMCRQVQKTLENIINYDQMMVETIKQIEDNFKSTTQIRKNSDYKRYRKILTERILSANSIFIFDGNLSVLRNRIRFFNLREVFFEALDRGTNIFTIGAGSELLCEKMLGFSKVTEDNIETDYFEFYDIGLGIIKNIQILPNDAAHLDLTSSDLLTHVASRFASHTSVCLDKDSYLFVETQVDEEHDSQQQNYIALGESDYLYIFTKEGRLEKKRAGEKIFPGKEISHFQTLIAPRTSPILVEFLQRIHHLEKAKSVVDIDKIIKNFIQQNNLPLKEGLTTTFFYYNPDNSIKGLYLASSLGRGGDNNTFFQYKNSGIYYLPVEFHPVSRLEYKYVLSFGERQYLDTLDPYNPEKAYSPFGANSVMTTLDFKPTAVLAEDPHAKKGKLIIQKFKSKIYKDNRYYQLYIPPKTDKPLPLVLFHDGYDYLNYSNLKTILDNMIHQKLIMPFVGIFSKPVDRLNEYNASPKYGEFIVEELLKHVQDHHDILPGPENTCSVGASLGGLFSMFLLETYPDIFGKGVSQSGSFFMKQGGFKSLANQQPQIVKFVEKFMSTPKRPYVNIVLTCGRFESLIYVNRIIVEALDKLDCDYRYFEYNDSHTWMGWANTMPTALINVFGREGQKISDEDVITPTGLISFQSLTRQQV